MEKEEKKRKKLLYMEQKDKKVAPFPQADDFDKIIMIINIEEVNKVKDKIYLSKLLNNISERQIAYYTSACFYLEILDENKNFTDFGNKLREKNNIEQEVLLCMKLMKNDIFSQIYFSEKILGIKMEKDDIINIMKQNNITFDSEEVYKRRATTVRSWIDWIYECSL